MNSVNNVNNVNIAKNINIAYQSGIKKNLFVVKAWQSKYQKVSAHPSPSSPQSFPSAQTLVPSRSAPPGSRGSLGFPALPKMIGCFPPSPAATSSSSSPSSAEARVTESWLPELSFLRSGLSGRFSLRTSHVLPVGNEIQKNTRRKPHHDDSPSSWRQWW